MKFYYENIRDATITYSGTADTSYPVSNLNNVSNNMKFKDSTPADGATIDIDLGSAKACDYIIIGNLITDGASVAISRGSDGSNFTNIGTVSTSQATASNTRYTFTSVTYRYWRLTFTETSSFDKVGIGNIFLGTEFELDHNPELEENFESGFEGILNNTNTGYKYSLVTQDTVRKIFSYDYQYFPDSEITTFQDMRDNVKMSFNESLYPLYFYDDELKFVRYQGRLKIKKQAYNANQTPIILIEEL